MPARNDPGRAGLTERQLLEELVGHVRTIKTILIILFVIAVVVPTVMALASLAISSDTTTEIENVPVPPRQE